MTARVLTLACLLCASACHGPTQLLLVVQTDLDLTQLGYVEIATSSNVESGLVTDDDGGDTQPCVCVSPTECPDSVVAFPLTIPLEPGTQGTVPFEVAARGHGPGPDHCNSTALVVDSAVLSFVPHERLGVYLALNGRCVDKMPPCGAGETCDPGNGQCVSNMTQGMPIASDLGHVDVPVDLAVPDLSVVPDLASPSYVKLVSGLDSNSRWDVASIGTGFSLIVLNGGNVSYGSMSGLPTAMTLLTAGSGNIDVCVSSDNGRYLYGVASSTTLTAYEPPGSMVPLSPGNIAYQSGLACAEGSSGVTLAWIDNHAPDDRTVQKTLKVVRKVGGSYSDPTPVEAAYTFALAKSGTPTILLHPNATVPPMAGSACPNLELYQLTNGGAVFMPTSSYVNSTNLPCVALSAGAPFGVAPLVAASVAGGSAYPSGTFEIGVPPTMFTLPLTASFSAVSMAPLPPQPDATQNVAAAVIYTGPVGAMEAHGLYLLTDHPSSTQGISEKLLSSTAVPTEPVKIAVDTAGNVLVTWVESITGVDWLVGQIVMH